MNDERNTETEPREGRSWAEHAETDPASDTPGAQPSSEPSEPPAPDPGSRVDVPGGSSASPQETESRSSSYQASETGVPYAQNPNYRGTSDPLRKCRTLTLVASIAGPVSLFVGGTLLDIAGLVCGTISYMTLNKILSQPTQHSDYAKALKRTTIVAMAICGVAMALNIATVITIMPELMQMLESGELADISAAPAPSAPSSTWG